MDVDDINNPNESEGEEYYDEEALDDQEEEGEAELSDHLNSEEEAREEP